MIISTQLNKTDPSGLASFSVFIAPAVSDAGIPIDHDATALAVGDAAFALERGIPAGSLYDYWMMTGRRSFIPAGHNIVEYTFEFECFVPDRGPEL